MSTKKNGSGFFKFSSIFLLVICLILCFTIFTILFPTTIIKLDSGNILDAIEISEIAELNESIPANANIYFEFSIKDNDLVNYGNSLLEGNTQYIDNLVIQCKDDKSIDVAFTTTEISSLISSIPSFITQLLNNVNVYINILPLYEGNNTFDFVIQSAYLGELSIPTGLFDPFMNDIEKQLKEQINSVNGLMIKNLTISDNFLEATGNINP